MRFYHHVKTFHLSRPVNVRLSLIVLFVALAMSACTATREQEIEGDVNEFRSWVNTQTNKLEERTEDDWKKTKQDFKRRTEELDRKQTGFSERVRADYQQIKADFKARERERDNLADRQSEMAKWERELLGQYANATSMSAANVEEPYKNFMSNVRARYKTWGQDDWEMASLVLEELNQRKAAFDEISDEAEVRIKAMQMEFVTMKESQTNR